jgi:CubicO group peptidase (beta-lactamase class C family)
MGSMKRRLSATLAFAALLGVSCTKRERHPVPAAASQRGVACFAEPFRQRLERGLAGYADVVDIPGLSYGIVRGNALVLSGGVGYADRSTKRPATADTPYNVGSLTKVFTATLALMYVEDGALELDAPVATYLPDSVRVPRDAKGGDITVRSLLNHTAGLARNPPNRRNQTVAGPIDPGV